MYTLFFIFWLIMNGKVTSEIVIIGLVLTVMAATFIYVLYGYTPKKDLHAVKKVPVFLAFFFLVIWEILKANLAVIRIILNKNRKIEPMLVTFQTDLKTDFGRYLLANAITLTPGTITVGTKGNLFEVHCLREDFLDTSKDNRLVKLIRKMEE